MIKKYTKLALVAGSAFAAAAPGVIEAANKASCAQGFGVELGIGAVNSRAKYKNGDAQNAELFDGSVLPYGGTDFVTRGVGGDNKVHGMGFLVRAALTWRWLFSGSNMFMEPGVHIGYNTASGKSYFAANDPAKAGERTYWKGRFLWGITAKLGMYVNPSTAIYIYPGFEGQSYSFKDLDAKSKMFWMGQIGIGIETSVSPDGSVKAFLNAEQDFQLGGKTIDGKADLNLSDEVAPGTFIPMTAKGKVSFKPKFQSQKVYIGIKYLF